MSFIICWPASTNLFWHRQNTGTKIQIFFFSWGFTYLIRIPCCLFVQSAIHLFDSGPVAATLVKCCVYSPEAIFCWCFQGKNSFSPFLDLKALWVCFCSNQVEIQWGKEKRCFVAIFPLSYLLPECTTTEYHKAARTEEVDNFFQCSFTIRNGTGCMNARSFSVRCMSYLNTTTALTKCSECCDSQLQNLQLHAIASQPYIYNLPQAEICPSSIFCLERPQSEPWCTKQQWSRQLSDFCFSPSLLRHQKFCWCRTITEATSTSWYWLVMNWVRMAMKFTWYSVTVIRRQKDTREEPLQSIYITVRVSCFVFLAEKYATRLERLLSLDVRKWGHLVK